MKKSISLGFVLFLCLLLTVFGFIATGCSTSSGTVTTTTTGTTTITTETTTSTTDTTTSTIATTTSTTTNTTTTTSGGESSWQFVGSRQFSTNGARYFSISFDLNGVPYLAYCDGVFSPTVGGGRISVMKYDTNWQQVGGDFISTQECLYSSLFVSGETPVVAYEEGPGYLANAKRYNGSTWETVGTPNFSSGEAAYTSLYIDQGVPYVAYRDDLAYGYRPIVKKCESSVWEVVGSTPVYNDSATYISLYVSGEIYVAYRDYSGSDNKARVSVYSVGSWGEMGGAGGFSSGEASSLSLAVYNAVPYVAYRDDANGRKLTVMRCFGNPGDLHTWEAVGPIGFTDSGVYSPRICLDNGTPYVAFEDESQHIQIMKYLNGSWESVGIPEISTGDTERPFGFNVLNGVPYVAFADGSDKKASVMKYGP